MNFENKANSGKGKSQKTFPVKETNTRIYRNEKPMEKDESNDSKIIEKEFYENFKPLIENSSNVSLFIVIAKVEEF